jgi:hypothetical protein
MLEFRNSRGEKRGDSMAGTFTRAFYLYYAVAFVVLIPATYYEFLNERWPKTILVFLYPAYAVLAWSFYKLFKAAGKGKRKPQ